MIDRFLVFVFYLLVGLCPGLIFAQSQGSNWYFGTKAGLTFNSSQPAALTDGALDTFEGCASISTPQGQILFYTDGVTVWNRNHDTLSNGKGLRGGQSTTQTALIIPKPGSSHLYYIFTASEAQITSDWSLCYSELDMNLDGGLGAITATKNTVLFTPIGEKITGVKHANNTDIWIISHDKFTNKYLTYLVTANGVNHTPLVFTGGTIDNGTAIPNLVSPNFGYMKASPDGTRIACAFSAKSRIDVLNFDRATGGLTFRFTLTQIPNAYGLEFSPNSQLLYATGYTGQDIRQYNLALSTLSLVVSTSVVIKPRTHLSVWSLQLGPDEKIYASRLGSGYLDCIQHPDNLGNACNFSEGSVYLEGKMASAGLPNFFPYFMRPSGILDRKFCPGDTTFFSLNTQWQPDSVKWNFGDPNSGDLNFSNALPAMHIYQQGGTYPVSVLVFTGSVVDTLEKPVTILPQPYVNLGPDTTFCEGTSIELNAFVGSGFNYSWGSPTTIYPTLTVVNQGPYVVTVSNSCGSFSDTIMAWKVSHPLPFTLGTDIELCEGNSVQLWASQPNTKTIWQDGSISPNFNPDTTGMYIAEVRNVCGSLRDSIYVTFNPLPTVSIGPDVSFCQGDSVWLKPTGVADAFLWSTGSVSDSISVTTSGVVFLQATNSCGVAMDTLVANKIDPPFPFNLGSNDTICENLIRVLNAFQPGVSYLWQDGSTNSGFSVSETGTYTVQVSNSCGMESDTIFIRRIPNPTVSLGPDINTCEGSPILLFANGNTDEYRWQDGSTSQTFLVLSSGLFSVRASNFCGTETDTVQIRLGKRSYDTVDVLECKPFVLNGILYSTTGTYIQTLVNSDACDSLLTLRARIISPTGQIFQTDSSLYYIGSHTAIQWVDCQTGLPISGANQFSFKPLKTGYFKAILKTEKCIDTSNCLYQFIPEKPTSAASVCDQLVISPNPTADLISFTLDKPKYSIRIYSISGSLITEKTGGKFKENLNFKDLAAALYILEIDGCRYKIVKQ